MPSTFQLAKLVTTTAILCLCLVTPASAQWKLNAGQSGQLEEYLARIGAEDLLLEHLESETAAQTNLESRRQLAGRLLDLYAKRMMSGEETKHGKWRKKSELILTTRFASQYFSRNIEREKRRFEIGGTKVKIQTRKPSSRIYGVSLTQS